jgi:CRP/FNR family cyclic AMP-dependent transcriptional regulator
MTNDPKTSFDKSQGGFMSLLDVVSCCEFLRGMPGDLVVRLGHIAHVRDYLAGTLLFIEGIAHPEFHVIVEGQVQLDMHVPQRGRVPILSVGPGEILAWSALLGNSVMTTTATALKDVRTVAFRADQLLDLCAKEHEAGYHIMRQLATALSHRLLATRLQLLDLSVMGGS